MGNILNLIPNWSDFIPEAWKLGREFSLTKNLKIDFLDRETKYFSTFKERMIYFLVEALKFKLCINNIRKYWVWASHFIWNSLSRAHANKNSSGVLHGLGVLNNKWHKLKWYKCSHWALATGWWQNGQKKICVNPFEHHQQSVCAVWAPRIKLTLTENGSSFQ
jgi:hypothetical protein